MEWRTLTHEGQTFTLYPDLLSWHPGRPIPGILVEDRGAPDYDFARNEFDHLLICVTNRCNITCDYCFRGFNMSKVRELEYDDLTEVADHFLARAQHNPTFQFTGGEVFVKRDIARWFAYLHERDFRIWMTTNGVSDRITSDEVLASLAGNPRAHVRISCDGHMAELYERHRGKPGTFAKVERNIRDLVAAGVPVSLKSVITSENFGYVEEILDWCYDLGVLGWNYNVIRYTGAQADRPPEDATCKSSGKIDYLGYEQLGRKLVDIVSRKPHLAPLLGISRFGKIMDTLYSRHPHGVPMSYYVLNYDGNVYYNDNLFREEFTGGNIWTDGVSAFRGLPEFRSRFDRALACCNKCPIQGFCFQKGDYGELYQRDPTMSAGDLEFPNCEDIRRHHADLMGLGRKGSEVLRSIHSFGPRFPRPQ